MHGFVLVNPEEALPVASQMALYYGAWWSMKLWKEADSVLDRVRCHESPCFIVFPPASRGFSVSGEFSKASAKPLPLS